MLLFDVDNLQKRYGHFEAIKGLTLKIKEGSVGLLGPNGAGKSTLIKTLLGLLDFHAGSASVLGYKLPQQKIEILQATGYMPENDCYLPYMSAIEYVSFGGELTGMPRKEAFRRAHEVLYYVGLQEARYRKLEGFSTGMKQRVKLAQALVHGPKLVFLDEPTNGLDPKGREEMLKLIGDVKARGVNVVLSSHILADVEQVCDTVIMMNQGQVVHSGSISELKGDGKRIIDVVPKQDSTRLAELFCEHGFEAQANLSRVKVTLSPEDDAQRLLEIARDHDVQIREFMPAELTLEAAFLGIIDEHDKIATSP